ncbi:CheR family methyltransferase [Helicobacter sp.]|uniref:CheR family methyltransferase n=1 Tax=Helicobacter sp. TaxID=218 RepID=UPI0025BAE426|nr:CheR family methyltransferase [Helicobacter sp.]MCI5968634.1 methyltransferase domain-containing protein [Helicobacter sp.]MDY2584457.1 CheR family methyltransferase [Helicobacter sp.]
MLPIINQEDINQARELIYEIAGIHMPQNKDATIRNRLDKLSRDLDIQDYSVFFTALKRGQFKQDFINAFTTNKTDFFREGFHFKDMIDRILPQRLQDSEPFKVFCSASSTGEEPYSIASTLLFAKEIYQSQTQVSVQAIDIDTSVLEVAKAGNYIVNTRLNPLPTWIELKDYFEIKELSEREISMNAKYNLKKILNFKQCNLCSPSYPFGAREFDIVFCRNVLIYFKIEDQEQILQKLFSHLKIGGTLYLGHSESILGLAPKVERLGQNIFLKVAD